MLEICFMSLSYLLEHSPNANIASSHVPLQSFTIFLPLGHFQCPVLSVADYFFCVVNSAFEALLHFSVIVFFSSRVSGVFFFLMVSSYMCL